MKQKMVVIFVALLCALGVVATATACETDTAPVPQGEVAVLTETVSTPEFQEEIAVLGEALPDPIGKMDVYAMDEDTLVYQFTLKNQLEGADAESAADQIQAYLQSTETVDEYENIIAGLEEGYGIPSATVIVKYLNKDGSTLAEQVYT